MTRKRQYIQFRKELGSQREYGYRVAGVGNTSRLRNLEVDKVGAGDSLTEIGMVDNGDHHR